MTTRPKAYQTQYHGFGRQAGAKAYKTQYHESSMDAIIIVPPRPVWPGGSTEDSGDLGP